MARPVGNIKPFCDPATATSTPHSSILNSMEPIELTPSTKSKAGWHNSSNNCLTAFTELVTPVAVSLWQTKTALIVWDLSCSRTMRYSSIGTPLPHSTSTFLTSRPNRLHISTHSPENWPKVDVRTLSPAHSVFEIAASQPPVPEPGNTKTRPDSVLKIFLRSSNNGSVKAGKSGARWSSKGISIAWRTWKGIFVGPGMANPLNPVISSSDVVYLRKMKKKKLKVKQN